MVVGLMYTNMNRDEPNNLSIRSTVDRTVGDTVVMLSVVAYRPNRSSCFAPAQANGAFRSWWLGTRDG